LANISQDGQNHHVIVFDWYFCCLPSSFGFSDFLFVGDWSVVLLRIDSDLRSTGMEECIIAYLNVRAGVSPSPVEYPLTFFQLFLTGVSKATLNSWVVLACSALSAFVTMTGSCVATRSGLSNRV